MPTVPRTALKNYPEIAEKVGLVVAEYSLLESLMAILFVYLVGGEPRAAFERFFTLRSAHRKEELARNAQCLLPDVLKKAHERIWRRFKTAANRRTEIAHCVFYDHGAGPMRTRMVGGIARHDPLTPQVFEHTFSQFHILGEDILVFAAIVGRLLGRDERIVAQLPFSPLDPSLLESTRSPNPPTQAETTEAKDALRRLGLAGYYQLDQLETEPPKGR